MATTTPPPISPPHEQPENHNHQPPITSPSSPTDYLDHQFASSYSPPLLPQFKPPLNSPDHRPPPPREPKLDHQQPPPTSSIPPPSPPPTATEQPPTATEQPPTETEQPPENFNPNPNHDHDSPLSKQQPSPSPLTTPAEPEETVEASDYQHINPNPTSDHESSLINQQSSLVPDDSTQSPNPNPNLDHESPKLEPNPNPNPSPTQSPKNPSPSPPLATESQSSPPLTTESQSSLHETTLEPIITTVTPPLGVPILHVPAATSSPAKPVISPWTHQETVNLIQAYQEKWYSLKKGPLKAGQWEEVAITVAARCGYDEPTKTSKQCRHKLEKLRKRYRMERGKPRSKANAWNLFKLMENLEKGPLPISSSPPMQLVEYQRPSGSNGKKRKNVVEVDDDDIDNDDGDGEYLINKRSTRARNHNQNHSRHVPNGYLTRNLRFTEGGSRIVRGLRTPVVHKPRKFYREKEEDEEEEEDNGDNGGEGGVAKQLAVEIKSFAEKFVKMENKKMEMIRDVERYRLEMENKRMEMIVESQQMLVETVNKAFSSIYKTHKLSAN